MKVPSTFRRWGSTRRRGLTITAAVVALGLAAAGAAKASGAITLSNAAADPSTRPSVPGAGDAAPTPSAGGSPSTPPSASPSAGASASPSTSPSTGTGPTLTRLTYTYPAGSGGNLQGPLGISAFKGHVYVSNTFVSVVSDINGGTTTSVAGDLEATGYRGDNGPANAASLSQPAGTAQDSAGNVYIADTENNVIRRIAVATGVITRFAGTGKPGGSILVGGPATLNELNAPQAVAVDAAGDGFIADTNNHRVLEVLRGGFIVPFAGTSLPGYSGDNGPAFLARLTTPTGVAVDSAGNVYIADAGNNVVRRVDARSGRITTVAGNVAADRAKDGLGGFSGDGGPATAAQLYDPEGVALDGAGDLFIADTFNHAIRMVTPGGTISTVVNHAGANGATPTSGSETNGPASASRLNGPCAVAVDRSTSTVYIADTRNNAAAAVTGLARSGSAPGPVAR
jgi:hypothetical protein